MKQSIQEYVQKMNKFNEFEIEQLKELDYKQKLKNFFELLKYSYSIFTKEEIEEFHKQKLKHLIDVQKTFMLCSTKNKQKKTLKRQ